MVKYNKSKISNGVRVVTEEHSDSRAIAIGMWVETGTRDEPENVIGISHFLEHLVFKGTETRTAYEIVRAFEAVGGEINAYTTREYTCFHGLVLKEDWEMALEILADLVTSARIQEADVDLEREVVLQEIAMSPDNLEEYAFDLYFEEAYRGHPMGRPILGTEDSLRKTDHAALKHYYKERYTGPKIIVSAAGSLNHATFVSKVEKLLGAASGEDDPSLREMPVHQRFRKAINRPSEQCHLLIGMESTGFNDDQRFEAYVVNALLGGGMTSKLYQSVREQRGLVYSIYSSLTSSIDCGLLTVYAATERRHIPEVLKTIQNDMREIRKTRITDDDLNLFKHQVRGSIILSSDDVENRMTSLGVNEMVFGRYRPVEDVVQEVSMVTAEGIEEYLARYFKPEEISLLLLGNRVESKDLRNLVEQWET